MEDKQMLNLQLRKACEARRIDDEHSDAELQAIEELIKKGADVNLSWAVGAWCSRVGEYTFTQTPLVHVLKYGNHRLAKLLVNSGASDQRAISALFEYCFSCTTGRKRYEMIKFLLERGFDVNFKTSFNPSLPPRTPLCAAAKRDCPDSVKLLIKHGALVNDNTFPSLLAISTAPRLDGKQAAVARLLLKNGADANVSDDRGTLLERCVVRGENVKLAKVLLRYGADPDVCSEDGDSLMEVACHEGNAKMVEVLLAHQKKFLPKYDDDVEDEEDDSEDEDGDEYEDGDEDEYGKGDDSPK